MNRDVTIIQGRNLLRQYNELKAKGYQTLWVGEFQIGMIAPVGEYDAQSEQAQMQGGTF